jgi:hypothetical protein
MLTSLHQKLNTTASYPVRPNTYPFLIRLIKTRMFGGSMSLDNTREQASHWCHKQAIDTLDAIQQITGHKLVISLRSGFATIFAQADARVASCPQKMGGAGNLDLLYTLIQHTNATRVIETGSAYGWSSLATLLAISSHSHRASPSLLYSTPNRCFLTRSI